MNRLVLASLGLSIYGALQLFASFPPELAPQSLEKPLTTVHHTLLAMGLSPGVMVFNGNFVGGEMNRSTCVQAFGERGGHRTLLYSSFPDCRPPAIRIIESSFDASLRLYARVYDESRANSRYWTAAARVFCDSEQFGNKQVEGVEVIVNSVQRRLHTGELRNERKSLVRYNCRSQT